MVDPKGGKTGGRGARSPAPRSPGPLKFCYAFAKDGKCDKENCTFAHIPQAEVDRQKKIAGSSKGKGGRGGKGQPAIAAQAQQSEGVETAAAVAVRMHTAQEEAAGAYALAVTQ